MVRMSSAVKWWTRTVAAVTGAVLTLVVPVHAWAATTGADTVAVEAARYRRRGGFGIFGAVCCIGVIVIAVVAYLLISRNRRKRG
jgi:hypothetical protein